MRRRALALTLVLFLGFACSDNASEPMVDAAAPDQKVVSSDLAPGDSSVPDSLTPDQQLPDMGPKVVPTWVGRSCAIPEDCLEPPKTAVTNEECLSGGEWEWPGGYCSFTCDAINNNCPEGSHCEELMATGANPTVCIKNCYNKTQCPAPGYVCADVPGTNYGGCIPFD